MRSFLFGVMGSAAVEVVCIVRAYEAGKQMSVRYSRGGVWVSRLLLALISGALAVADNVPNDLLAVHIGAATPAIIQMFASRPPAE